MEIIRHLSTEELRDLAIESDQHALRPTLEALPEWARASTERPEEFWEAQRRAIWSRISAPERSEESGRVRRSPVLAWAALAAMIVLSGLLLNRAPLVPPQTAQVHADPDHELLLAVERAVHSEGPAALDPAALLAEEMVQNIASAHAPIRKKEPTHEN
jgi:hypothetical protein